MMVRLRRLIASAAPTCALWSYSPSIDALVFRPWPRWRLSGLEIFEARRR